MWKLFGLLLGYPKCCIEGFMNFENNGVSYNGFKPCSEHTKVTRSEIEHLIGRTLDKEPVEFLEFTCNPTYDYGMEVYGKVNKAEFFASCWEGSSL